MKKSILLLCLLNLSNLNVFCGPDSLATEQTPLISKSSSRNPIMVPVPQTMLREAPIQARPYCPCLKTYQQDCAFRWSQLRPRLSPVINSTDRDNLLCVPVLCCISCMIGCVNNAMSIISPP